jgi:hypothetical protein
MVRFIILSCTGSENNLTKSVQKTIWLMPAGRRRLEHTAFDFIISTWCWLNVRGKPPSNDFETLG